MAAEILEITSRHRPSPIGFADPADFRLSAAGTADAGTVLRPEVTLYCLDEPRRRALFVECDPAVDISAAPFYYQAQFEHAHRVVALPYDELHRLAATVQDPRDRLVLLYTTGRCGSTLLSGAFRQVPGVTSLSEPDVLTQLVALRPTDGSADAEVQSRAEACMKLLCKPPRRGVAAPARWVVKFRSMGIELADLLHRAFPTARAMFLYRNAEAVVESSLRSYTEAPAPPDASTPQGRELIGRYVSWLRGGPLRQLLRVTGAGLRAAVTEGDFRILRRVGRAAVRLGREEPAKEELYAVLWLSVVARYVELNRAGIVPAAFRYETLLERPHETMEAVFRHAGLPAEAAPAAWEAVKGRDSQQDSPLARDRARAGSGTDDAQRARLREVVRTVVAIDRRIATSHFIAPGTIGA